MGNEATTETQTNQSIGNVNNIAKSQSNTADVDIQTYFNTKFPVVISQEVFDIRYK